MSHWETDMGPTWTQRNPYSVESTIVFGSHHAIRIQLWHVCVLVFKPGCWGLTIVTPVCILCACASTNPLPQSAQNLTIQRRAVMCVSFYLFLPVTLGHWLTFILSSTYLYFLSTNIFWMSCLCQIILDRGMNEKTRLLVFMKLPFWGQWMFQEKIRYLYVLIRAVKEKNHPKLTGY